MRFATSALFIAKLLTSCVRVLTDEQIGVLLGCRVHEARRLMRRGRTTGLTDSGMVLTPTFRIAPRTYVAQWQAGQPEPDFAEIARMLRERIGPTQMVRVYFATLEARKLFGGWGGSLSGKEVSQVFHDLGVSWAFVRHYEAEPERTLRCWRHENSFKDEEEHQGYKQKLPDAKWVEDGEVRRLIEGAGNYSSWRLRVFHEYCASQDRDYHLW